MIGVRPLLASAWMGIQHDLAWTTPALSLVLRAVAPFASAMTTCIIYWFGTRFSPNVVFDPSRLAFVLVGSTLYAHVASYAWVPTTAIAEAKNLSVFPHVYLTSRSTGIYLAGRMLSAFATSVVTSVLALVLAFIVLSSLLSTSIPLVVTPLSTLMLALALLANIPGAFGLGFLLGAYSLYASKFEWSLPGYVAGLLMVFSGALFSPSILPWPVSAGAWALPFTQFISAARDAIAPSLANPVSNYPLAMAECLAGGLIFLVASVFVYLAAERKARRDGVLDRRLA
jgi:hypothetical protein